MSFCFFKIFLYVTWTPLLGEWIITEVNVVGNFAFSTVFLELKCFLRKLTSLNRQSYGLHKNQVDLIPKGWNFRWYWSIINIQSILFVIKSNQLYFFFPCSLVEGREPQEYNIPIELKDKISLCPTPVAINQITFSSKTAFLCLSSSLFQHCMLV